MFALWSSVLWDDVRYKKAGEVILVFTPTGLIINFAISTTGPYTKFEYWALWVQRGLCGCYFRRDCVRQWRDSAAERPEPAELQRLLEQFKGLPSVTEDGTD